MELEPGCYLIEETRPDRSFQLFSKLANDGYLGFCITREYPHKIKEKYHLDDTPVIWLTSAIGRNCTNPKKLDGLTDKIFKFIQQCKNSVVLLEGLEYLILNNDFPSVMRTIGDIIDYILQNDSRLLLPIDPRTLNDRELAVLERYTELLGDLIEIQG